MNTSLTSLFGRAFALFSAHSTVFIVSSFPIFLFALIRSLITPIYINQQALIVTPPYIHTVVAVFYPVLLTSVSIFQVLYIQKAVNQHKHQIQWREIAEKITIPLLVRTIWANIITVFVTVWPAIVAIALAAFVIVVQNWFGLQNNNLIMQYISGNTTVQLSFLLYTAVLAVMSVIRLLRYVQIVNLSLLQSDSVWSLVKKSKEVMQGNKIKMFFILIVYFVLIFINGLVFGVASIIIQPFMLIVMVLFTQSLLDTSV
jgi:hypothetical protein